MYLNIAIFIHCICWLCEISLNSTPCSKNYIKWKKSVKQRDLEIMVFKYTVLYSCNAMDTFRLVKFIKLINCISLNKYNQLYISYNIYLRKSSTYIISQVFTAIICYSHFLSRPTLQKTLSTISLMMTEKNLPNYFENPVRRKQQIFLQ